MRSNDRIACLTRCIEDHKVKMRYPTVAHATMTAHRKAIDRCIAGIVLIQENQGRKNRF